MVSHGVPFRDEVFKYAGELTAWAPTMKKVPLTESSSRSAMSLGVELAGAVVEGQRHDGYSLGAGIDWAPVRSSRPEVKHKRSAART